MANLLFLASVIFLPFPTSVIAEYPATAGSVSFHALSVAAVGVLTTMLFLVAQRPALLAPDEVKRPVWAVLLSSLGAPLVFLISAGVAVAQPCLAKRLWWLVAPAVWGGRWLGRLADRTRATRNSRRLEQRPSPMTSAGRGENYLEHAAGANIWRMSDRFDQHSTFERSVFPQREFE